MTVNNSLVSPTRALLLRQNWVLLLLALWLLSTLGLRPLLLPDEGRYSNVAREMLFGDGLLPTLNGLPFFHKPPLMYWLNMAAMSVFGVNAFSARIASAIGAWLMGAAIYLDLRRRAGPHQAAVVLGVLATCPLFFVGGQYANHDMLVAGLITVAVNCARRAVDDPPRTALRWVAAAWCAAALAVLTKGLIGVVLPALIIGPWLLAQRRWRQLASLMHPLGLTVFALVAVPWFVAMQWRYPGFVDYFFMEQQVRRYVQLGFNNVQPFWFFVPVLLLLTLPWSVWLIAVLRRLRARVLARANPASLLTTTSTQTGLHVWWIVVVVGFFSLPSSKLVGYVLPALPPLAVLFGLAAYRGRVWRWVMLGAAIGCVAIVAALAWNAPGSHRDIGWALSERLRAGDRVVFVDNPFFDVSYYAGMTQPPIMLADWDDPDIARRDNWHKELYDAARFEPQRAAQLLWRTSHVVQLMCAAGTVWFVADKHWQPPAGLGDLTRVVEGRHADLLRATGGPRPACP